MALDLRGGNSILGLMGHIQEQGELGRQEGNRRGLAGLLSKGMTANPMQQREMLSRGFAIDPEGTQKVAGIFKQQNDDALDYFGKLSAAAAANPGDPHLLRQWAQAGAQINMLPPEVLQKDFSDPADIEGAGKAVQAYAQAFGQRGAGVPAGYQEFDLMARAGGLEGDDRQRAARIALGMDPRASSAAIKYMEVEGADGRTRIVAMDPRDVGAQVIGGGEMYGSGVPSPQGGDPFGFLAQAGATVTSAKRSPEHNAKVGGVPNSYHLSGQARDILPPTDPQQAAFIRQQAQANGLEVIDEGDHWHLEPARRQPQGANPFVGRRAEDETYATESAKHAAGLQYAGPQAQADAQREAMVTTAREQAQTQVEQAASAPQAITKANETIALLEKALRHPGRATATGMSGALDPRNYLRGTDARNFQVLLDQLGGRAFLEAFESLKGGGQITEIEGRKATDAMARLSTAQSDAEFEAALKELLGIAKAAKERAQSRLGGSQQPGSSDPLGILD